MSTIDTTRGSTDHTTNVTVLPDLPIEDLPRLLRLGESPERLLPSFLHEATHHWCFESSVGTALAVLQLRIHRAAVMFEESRETQLTHELAEALNRYETALAFLHPLDEGMALFAEFDIISRPESRVWSQPLEHAAVFFQQPRLSPTKVSGELFTTAWAQDVLQKMRLGPATLDRKVNVLGQPLSCHGDAYLSGYLLVRQLWIEATRNDWRLASETDLFLMYLRSFLYEDTGLVAALLSSALDEIRGAEAVANRIMWRLRQLSELSPAMTTAFEDWVAEGSIGRDERLTSALMLDPREESEGLRLLKNAVPGSGRGDVASTESAFDAFQERVLLRRQLLYVGSWDGDVAVAHGRFEVHSGDKVVLEGVARPGTEPGHGPGTIDVLQLVPRRQRVSAVFRRTQLVATQSFLVDPQENDEQLLDLIAERDEARNVLRGLDRLVSTVVDATWVAVAVEHVRQMVTTVLDQVYLPVILHDVPLERLDATILALQGQGFYPLLDYDRRHIEGLAALGIACSIFPPTEGFVSAFLEQRGLDYAETLAAADELFATHGLARVWREEGSLLATV